MNFSSYVTCTLCKHMWIGRRATNVHGVNALSGNCSVGISQRKGKLFEMTRIVSKYFKKVTQD